MERKDEKGRRGDVRGGARCAKSDSSRAISSDAADAHTRALRAA